MGKYEDVTPINKTVSVNNATQSESFSSMHDKSTSYFMIFVVAGGALLLGILLMALPIVNIQQSTIINQQC